MKRIFHQLGPVILTVFMGASTALAQDIHFSQFYLSPLTLNPALTGQFNGDFRVAANYRNQWRSVNKTPFTTMSITGDLNVYIPGLRVGALGAGITLFSDRSGTGAVGNTTVMLSGAYRAWADKRRRHQLGIGIQGGFVRKSIDYNKLVFGNEFQTAGTAGQPGFTGPRTEEEGEPFSYADFGGGFNWRFFFSNKLEFDAGISLFHINQPNESFIDDPDNKLNTRRVLHIGSKYKINNKINLHPRFIIMSQSKDQEINLGSLISYHMSQGRFTDVILFAGMQVRASAGNTNVDALFPSVGAQYKNIRMGVSYDLNVSGLKNVSHFRAGPEIAFIYIGNLNLSSLPIRPILPCTRF